ncbi:MAG: glycosyltransferase family 39 protein [bacterium]|nr:glycosyltransferase family 39 protein [bacterium]MDT8394980.1 glycosyltransferase family 39 protein [bacterium]
MKSGIDRYRGETAALAALGTALILAGISAMGSGPGWLLAQNIRALAWGVVVAAAAWIQGTVLLHFLFPDHGLDRSGLRLFLAGGVGLAAMSLEALFLGLAGLYTRPALTLLVLAVLGTGWAAMKMLRVPFPPLPVPRGNSALFPLGLTGVALFLNFTFVLVPPVYFDAMSYHLELPSRYLQDGRIFHIPENLYSGYPQLVEVLYGVGLALAGVGTAGIISLLGFILVLGLVWSWGRERFDDETAAWAIVLVAFTPPLMTVSGFFHNDWYMTFFTLGTVLLLSGLPGDRMSPPGTIVLAGVLAGFAAGTKYTGLGFAIGVPAAAGLLLALKREEKGAARKWALFGTIALATASPWYLKNMLFTGDPLFPLISGLTGQIPGLSSLAGDAYFKGFAAADLWKWTLVPYQSVFRYWELQLSLSTGLVPLVLLPTVAWLYRTRSLDPFLLLWTGLSLTVWYLTFRAGRFAMPMAVMTLLWFAAAFRGTVREAPRAGPVLTGVVVFLAFMNLAAFLGFMDSYADAVSGAFGRLTSREYLERTYAPYGAITYLNRAEPPPEKVLFLGEMKGFYSGFDREVATFEVPNRLVELVRAGKMSDEIADTLLARGFSHILYNPVEMERLAAKTPSLRLDPEEWDILNTFLKERTKKVFVHSGISVWKVQHD